MKKLKTITVTTHRARNYGAVLQAYALQKTLEAEGYENALLDSNNENNKFFNKVSFSSLKGFLISLYVNLKRLLHIREVKERVFGFETFVKNRLKVTDKFVSEQQLLKDPPPADVYISGSDQVFAIDCSIDRLLLKERFLDFGPDTTKRISYAAGVGGLNLNDRQLEELGHYLSRFDSVSLREKSSVEYYSKCFDCTFRNDLDPTFLLTKQSWTSIMSPRLFPEPYILCYALLGNKDLQKTIDFVKKKTGMKVVCVEPEPLKRVKADKYYFNASPEDFLSLIYYSDYVVTTSFHGTAFSVIFEKQFYSLIKDYKSERMIDLLELLGLKSNLIREGCAPSSFEAIDYKNVNAILEKERSKSLEYIKGIRKIVNND